ncbi:MAG: hypothetical protein JO050_01400 [Acidimicrobiia bacterium]|nr:hypothetical protein [Acidimicrobiia bacterium]
MKRAAAWAAVAAVLLAACGGGGGTKKTAAQGATTTTGAGETTTTASGDTTTTAAGGAGATATTKAAAKPATAGAATVNGKPAAGYQPPPGATPAKPATPGTYTYDNSVPAGGTNTFGAPPATSPMTIDPPNGTVQHSTVTMGSGKTGTTLDYRSDGVHLVEVKITSGSQSFDFVGNPPPLAAPTGVQPGQSADFTLTSNPPGTTIQVHTDFVRMETITIGGQHVNTMVIHQVGTLTGQLQGTQTQDAWVSQQYDLFVQTHQVADVKYGAFAAHSDVMSVLQKLTPS